MLFLVCVRRPTELGSPSQKNNNQLGGLFFFWFAYEDRQSSEPYEDRRSSDLPGVRQGDPRIKTTINWVVYAFSGLCVRSVVAFGCVSNCFVLQRIYFFHILRERVPFFHILFVIVGGKFGSAYLFFHILFIIFCWRQIWESITSKK